MTKEKLNHNRYPHNEAGASLIQALIATFVVGLTALVYVKNVDLEHRAQQHMTLKGDFNSIKRFIIANVSCANTNQKNGRLTDGICKNKGKVRLYGNDGKQLEQSAAFKPFKNKGWQLESECLAVGDASVTHLVLNAGGETKDPLTGRILDKAGAGNNLISSYDNLCSKRDNVEAVNNFYIEAFDPPTAGCSNITGNFTNKTIGSLPIEVHNDGANIEISFSGTFGFTKSYNPNQLTYIEPVLSLSGPTSKTQSLDRVYTAPLDSFSTSVSGSMVVNNVSRGSYTVRLLLNANSNSWDSSAYCNHLNVVIKEFKSL